MSLEVFIVIIIISSNSLFSMECLPIKVLVKSLDSHLEEFILSPSLSVQHLMQRVSTVFQIPETRQRLLYQGQLLLPEESLHSFSLQDGSVIQLIAYRHPDREKKSSNTASQCSSSNHSPRHIPPAARNLKTQQQRMNGFELDLT